jgi:phenylacetate-coenzyme A ligase PaaK-like adenylate-forming protein
MNANELLKAGRRDEVWTKYCGFLDLDLSGFMEIQRRLLMEQVNFLLGSDCAITRKFIEGGPIESVADFRKAVPVTTYEDYEEFLAEQRDEVLPRKPIVWAHTSGRSGKMKWVPYTKEAYESLGERVLAGVILSAARWKGDVRIDSRDTLVYNTPPRPYISGVTLRALADHFDFDFIPPLDETEGMDFQERIARGFDVGLVTGIDILGSLAVVLVKMGQRFAEGARTTKLSAHMLHPKALFRMVRGWLRAKLEGRAMLPKDLWRLKSIPSGGMDTSIYREKIEYYWGVAPFEQYGSTEEGAIATQAWNKKGMTFFPDAAFLEFLPEEEWAKIRLDPAYIPQTRLLDEVEPGKRYELVISNFFGKPLLRYRMHDVVKFTALEDSETGVKLPQMVFVGRSSDFIDLAGYTGLLDEKLVWQSILDTEIAYEEWAVRKEMIDEKVVLHLYIETVERVPAETIRERVNANLKAANKSYADYEKLIEDSPIIVSVIERGSFGAFMKEKAARGADMAHLKPPHMNPSDEDVRLLLEKSAAIGAAGV